MSSARPADRGARPSRNPSAARGRTSSGLEGAQGSGAAVVQPGFEHRLGEADMSTDAQAGKRSGTDGIVDPAAFDGEQVGGFGRGEQGLAEGQRGSRGIERSLLD